MAPFNPRTGGWIPSFYQLANFNNDLPGWILGCQNEYEQKIIYAVVYGPAHGKRGPTQRALQPAGQKPWLEPAGNVALPGRSKTSG